MLQHSLGILLIKNECCLRIFGYKLVLCIQLYGQIRMLEIITRKIIENEGF